MLFSNSIEGNRVIEHLTKKYRSLRHIYLYYPQGYWVTWSRPNREDKDGSDRIITSVCIDVTYDWFS